MTHADNYVGVQVTHPECNINQHDVETNNNHHMSDASVVGSSVDDPTCDSKMVGNANQDITTHDGSHTTGRADSSAGVPVIHPDYDMGYEDTDYVIPNDVIPNSQSCRSCIMSLIVDLNDAFSKEGQFTENNITGVDESHRPIFEEKDLQLFWDARHESLCYNDNGKLVRC